MGGVAVDLKAVRGRNPRQRVWEAIRASCDDFTAADIEWRARTSADVVADYFKCLKAGGYIEVAYLEPRSHIATVAHYRLVRDNGVEAPRLTKDGKPVTQGLGNENMWRAMRIIGEFDYRELAAHASTETAPVSAETACTYVLTLAKAGYLRQTVPPVRGRNARPARYRLIPGRYTGPKAPMIQRTKSLYDPNEGRVVWTQPVAEEEIDG